MLMCTFAYFKYANMLAGVWRRSGASRRSTRPGWIKLKTIWNMQIRIFAYLKYANMLAGVWCRSGVSRRSTRPGSRKLTANCSPTTRRSAVAWRTRSGNCANETCDLVAVFCYLVTVLSRCGSAYLTRSFYVAPGFGIFRIAFSFVHSTSFVQLKGCLIARRVCAMLFLKENAEKTTCSVCICRHEIKYIYAHF